MSDVMHCVALSSYKQKHKCSHFVKVSFYYECHFDCYSTSHVRSHVIYFIFQGVLDKMAAQLFYS